MTLRDRLRAGDIWGEGSGAVRSSYAFLFPPAVFAAKRKADELGLAVPDRFETWRDERLETLERRLREVGCWGAMEQLWNAFHNCSIAPQHPTSRSRRSRVSRRSSRQVSKRSGTARPNSSA